MKKTMFPYMIVSLILFAVTCFYGLFAHGVTSIAMESMAWVCLAGGFGYLVLVRFIKNKLVQVGWFKLFYNSALAFLINDLFIRGVLHIAGGFSTYEPILLILSLLFGLISAWLYLKILIPSKTT